MYLSRLILNPRSRAVQRDLGNCQQLHRTILKAFPQTDGDGANARELFGVLYRLDVDKQTGTLKLLVQSKAEPDWQGLPDDYLLQPSVDAPSVAWKKVDSSYQSLSNGMRLMFRLRGNPTKCISSHNQHERTEKFVGKRVEIRGEENQIEWLRRKGELAGFKLTSVRINPEAANVAVSPEARVRAFLFENGTKQTGERKQKPLVFGSALFEGELVITDADAFRQAIITGIGTGKAYGFGLLSIAQTKR